MNKRGRLTTRIGRFTLSNPVICGSGEPVMTAGGVRAALAAGAAGVIAKSVNEQQAAARQLDRADFVYLASDHRPAPNGASLFCRSGLAQRGAAEWFGALATIDREAISTGRFVAASIVLGSPEGAERLAALARLSGLRVLELNVGAPHAAEAAPGAIGQETEVASLAKLVSRVRIAARDMQLWVKLTGLATNLPALAAAATEAGADAVVMMGRFLAMVPDLDTLSPVLGTSAAYGGPWALPIVCRYLAQCRRALGPAVPLIATNGARSGSDIARFALAGAAAAEVLSVIMADGFGAITRIIGELDGLLAARGHAFADLIGCAADALGSYADQRERPGHWRNFVPPETIGSQNQ
jgi:dihydroorotate dehydrogenase (NAD+) catalytic subunit